MNNHHKSYKTLIIKVINVKFPIEAYFLYTFLLAPIPVTIHTFRYSEELSLPVLFTLSKLRFQLTNIVTMYIFNKLNSNIYLSGVLQVIIKFLAAPHLILPVFMSLLWTLKQSFKFIVDPIYCSQ